MNPERTHAALPWLYLAEQARYLFQVREDGLCQSGVVGSGAYLPPLPPEESAQAACSGSRVSVTCARRPTSRSRCTGRISGGLLEVMCSGVAERRTTAVRQGRSGSRHAQYAGIARARKLRRAQTWDGITDAEIMERDGWRCQIPGCKRRPIQKDLKYPHLRSKSIDHIIPLSLGGDDTAVNKRAAHLGCNMGRSNKAGEEQLPLFGSLREPPLIPAIAGTVRATQAAKGQGAEGQAQCAVPRHL